MKKSKKKIRILTYHWVANNGAILQAYSLSNYLGDKLNNSVRIFDYRPLSLELYEIVKIFKIYPKLPLFNLKRLFRLRKFVDKNLPLDKKLFLIMGNLSRITKAVNKQKCNLIVVGSDNIWRISEEKHQPNFPNIYWLGDKITSKRISIAASAYNSSKDLITKNEKEIKDRLDSFDFIGVRDNYTYNLAKRLSANPGKVYKNCDPTFLFKIKKTKVKSRLEKMGIDFSCPIIGILIHGKEKLSRMIYKHYHKMGYQVVALSMYNKHADYNLGHLLNPFEWAEVFKYFNFCITDRFHGTIFCLKNHTPFVSIEPSKIGRIEEGKLYSLLNDFRLTENYFNIFGQGFSINKFLSSCELIEENWGDNQNKLIDKNIKKYVSQFNKYINKINKTIYE